MTIRHKHNQKDTVRSRELESPGSSSLTRTHRDTASQRGPGSGPRLRAPAQGPGSVGVCRTTNCHDDTCRHTHTPVLLYLSSRLNTEPRTSLNLVLTQTLKPSPALKGPFKRPHMYGGLPVFGPNKYRKTSLPSLQHTHTPYLDSQGESDSSLAVRRLAAPRVLISPVTEQGVLHIGG